jgi:hypothetical protein
MEGADKRYVADCTQSQDLSSAINQVMTQAAIARSWAEHPAALARHVDGQFAETGVVGGTVDPPDVMLICCPVNVCPVAAHVIALGSTPDSKNAVHAATPSSR